MAENDQLPELESSNEVQVPDIQPEILELHNTLTKAIRDGADYLKAFKEYSDFVGEDEEMTKELRRSVEELLTYAWNSRRTDYFKHVLEVCHAAGDLGTEVFNSELENREKTGKLKNEHLRIIAGADVKPNQDTLDLIRIRLRLEVEELSEISALIESVSL